MNKKVFLICIAGFLLNGITLSAQARHQQSYTVIRYEQFLNIQRDQHNRHLDQRNLALAIKQNPPRHAHKKGKSRSPKHRHHVRTPVLVQDHKGRCYRVEQHRGQQVLKRTKRRACR